MRCILNKNCFEEGQSRYISTIIGIAVCHADYNEVCVDDDRVFDSEVYSNLSTDDQNLLRLSYENAVIGQDAFTGEIISVDIHGDSESEAKIFSPSEAVDYISEPLSVLVENSLNDGYFIKALIRSFGSYKINKALLENKVRMDNSGGCGNTRNRILSYLQGNPKPKNLRLYIIWDSDKEYVLHEQNKYNKDIEDLADLNVNYHILCKRAIENYMPDEALRQLCGKPFLSWYNAYSHLTAIQKDYYCVADGFTHYKAETKGGMPEAVVAFFSDLSETNWNYLKDGFKMGNFKTEYPKMFEDTRFVYKASLLERTSHQDNPSELPDLVSEIEALL